MKNKKVLIIGAGFTGLAAATELIRHNIPFTIIEKSSVAGGLSRTIDIDGVKFELGPHIYFDKDPEVVMFWRNLVGNKMKSYERNNRIFYKGKYINSPLNLWNAFITLGPLKIIQLITSFLYSKFRSYKIESAEDWVKANFGEALFNTFFRVYNEKIWGLKCHEISPNWAGQRIKSSLFTMIIKSLRKDKDFIVKTFLFPDGGSQSIYNSQIAQIESFENGKIIFNKSITKIDHTSSGFTVYYSDNNSENFTDIISTIHLEELGKLVKSENINYDLLSKSISRLIYRHLILVNLVFLRTDVKNFKEHWIDIHDPTIRALRVTNFGNYDFGLSDDNRLGVGVEYNCFQEDDIWHMSDEEIINIALSDLKLMKLINNQPINGSVVRLQNAYPVYFKNYEFHINIIMEEFAKVKGLQLAGRNSMYKWNNMHHSVKTGILAARNVIGEKNDLLSVKGMVAIGKDSD